MAKSKKKTASKKTTSKKAVTKKAASNKAVSKKTSVSKKSAPKKKVATKKATTKKKVITKKKVAPAKKTVKKKATPQKPNAKAKAKPAAKKVVAKKAVTKKAPDAAKKATKRAIVEKKAATATKATTKKKVAAKKKETEPTESERVSQRAKIMALAKEPEAAPKKPKVVRKLVSLDDVSIDDDYRPSDKEEYMCPKHLLYFQRKLKSWQAELIIESQETLENLRSETRDVGDEAERASRESDNILELRTRDRYRKLLRKIDEGLKRIDEGTYGFCEETGDEIGIGRLEARPIATLTVDAQERREMFQRQFRDER